MDPSNLCNLAIDEVDPVFMVLEQFSPLLWNCQLLACESA